MERYRALGGDSGVVAYQIGERAIAVQFHSGEIYHYTYASAGRRNIERMKRLARAGKGLSTFISQHVHDACASKDPAPR
ncbi:MAG TPA: hypothetical protein VFG03_22655 [Telluria sp.]|nr:hypothetical protein [Telluria sp.]